ncbi:MAG: hypothetical protein L0Z62_04565 [Gemmataceae bacterium]|nr:hypothetical protein [Gemmataceae bacterium]
MRRICLGLAGLLLFVLVVRAGGDGLKGTWKVSFVDNGIVLEPWLLKLETKDGKVTGELKIAKGVPDSKLEGLRLEGRKLSFTIELGGQPFEFELLVPKDSKVIRGTLMVQGQVVAARLEPTKLESMTFKKPGPPEDLDYKEAKERIAKKLDDPRTFDYAQIVLRRAKKEGAKAEEVKGWTDALRKAAADHGPRWEQEITLRLAEHLVAGGGYPELTETLTRQGVKLVGDKGPAETQLRGMNLLAAMLKKAGKDAELKTVAARIEKLEEQGHTEALQNLPFKLQKVEAKTRGRAVLVELFTGAQCPPCVAIDLAFDGLKKTFSPRDVVLLQYHLHIPGKDALTNPATESRQEYYGEAIQGTPTVIMDGKLAEIQGGFRQHAATRYKEWLKVLQPLLARESKAKIDTEAVRKGEEITITTSVSGLEKPGKKVKLRLALVDGWARYQGRNGLAYHSRVVRAMPGGPDGVDLPKDGAKHTVTVDLEKLQRDLNRYLDKQGFSDGQRPLRFRDLSVVAFVQDDETREVLQAIDVPMRGDKK